MNTLTLKVPEILNTQLNSYAEKKGLNKSEIVRLALIEYLSKDHSNSTNSFLSLSKDLAGSVNGPSDLSTNKAYLKDYGKRKRKK
jgi:metal-responsive CopG/Arc/MetJ family transcriptional regulator